MERKNIFSAGTTPACMYAVEYLRHAGWNILETAQEDADILLLDVPSFRDNGELRGGGKLEPLLESLPRNIPVCGGKLAHDALRGYPTLDLLQDPRYVAQNAYITAECALQDAVQEMPVLLRDCPVLIIGWGRIGKCLGQLLKNIGADVTIAARRDTDRAMLQALGYNVMDPARFEGVLHRFRLIYNTAPEPVLTPELVENCREDCVKIDLASKPGILGGNVIHARGLPGIHAPESSGKLIAETLIRSLKEDYV